MRGFSQPIPRRDGKYRLLRKDYKWHFENADGSRQHGCSINPADSLVEMLFCCSYEMNFFQFAGRMYDYDLTINELYDENPRATLDTLCHMLVYMLEFSDNRKVKHTQSKESIEKILHGPGENIYPILKHLLEGFLQMWESCPHPVE